MSHIPITIAAYILNGISVTIDKFLITKKIPDPLIYIFYYSIVSLVALLLLPFVKTPSLNVLITASVSTILWSSAAYFMLKALQTGQVSRVIPIVGTLNPVILLAVAFAASAITLNQTLGVVLLIAGMVFLTLMDWQGDMSKKELILEITSASLFALSYLVLRQAYLMDNFLSVFVWSRPILIPVGLALLAIPKTRKIVLNLEGPKINIFSKAGALFAVGQLSGGISELMLIFAISLANPVLVNSLQGTQYIFLFILSLLLAKKFPEVFKERFTKLTITSKSFGIVLIAIGLYLLAVK